MSSKADTLFRKATSYERLVLYGDRKDYLNALAQISFPDVNAIISAVNAARTKAVASITNFWRQDPNTFPMSAREALSALRYPQVDITSATGEQLTTGMDQLTTALTDVYRALTGTDVEKNADFAQQVVYPVLQSLQTQVQKYKNAVGEIPQPRSLEDNKEIPAVSSETSQSYPNIPTDIQSDLNRLLNLQIKIDGKLGPETRGALDKFRAEYNVPNNATDQDVFNSIKYNTSR